MSSRYEEMARVWLKSMGLRSHINSLFERDIANLAAKFAEVAASARGEALIDARLEMLTECMNAPGARSPGVDQYNAGVSHCLRVAATLAGAK